MSHLLYDYGDAIIRSHGSVLAGTAAQRHFRNVDLNKKFYWKQ